MVAPIIPALSNAFGISVQTVGLVVPAYLIPYGIATLIFALLADRHGVQRVMFASLTAFAALTALTGTATSIEQIALWRVLTGLGASGVVPLALVLVGKLFPYEQRGRPLGWLFGAMAGGMAFGSPLGAMLVPFIGWQGLFLLVGAAGGIVLLLFLPYRRIIATAMQPVGGTLGDLFRGYLGLLGTPRGRRTYGYVFVNSMFHSGVFTAIGRVPTKSFVASYHGAVLDNVYHVQTANNYHEQLKTWIQRGLRGVATKNLPFYLAWKRLSSWEKGGVSAPDILVSAMGRQVINL